MTLQSIGPRQWRGSLFPLGRIVLAMLLIGGGVAQIAVKALRGVLALVGAAPAIYYIAYLLTRAVRKGHIMKPSRGRGREWASVAL